MTNEKAIHLLHRLQDEQFDGIHVDERREALEMAVRVLEGDGDLISRQAVMKEFSDFVRKSNNSDFAPTPTWNDAVSLVGSMPSAQPVNYGSTKSDSSSQLKLNNDLISRQAAIIVIDNSGLDDDSKDTVVRVLEQLPSAQPEIKCVAQIKMSMEDLEELVAEKVDEIKHAQLEPHWIPCSERLPKEFDGKAAVCEVFLVTVKVDNHYYVDLAENFGCYIDDFWDTVNDWNEGNDVHVVAWMPLPKPYGGESE